MNVNDENAVRAALHEATGGKQIVLDAPLASADEMLAFAEQAKSENLDLYGSIEVRKAGPGRVVFEATKATTEGAT